MCKKNYHSPLNIWLIPWSILKQAESNCYISSRNLTPQILGELEGIVCAFNNSTHRNFGIVPRWKIQTSSKL